MFKISTFVLFFVSLVCACNELPENIKQPNIILILTDDQGWGDLSINGNSNLSTPNIDRIGNEGVIFDRFFVSAVCSPTRAEILTGRYSPRTGVYSTSAGGERIDLDETMLSELFKKAGYSTAAYGKWHSGMQAPYHPNTRGFDDYYGFCSGHWGNYYSPMLEHNGNIVKGEGFLPDDLTSKSLEFIEKNKDNPFFLYIPYNTPHSPMQAPDKFWSKFKDMPLGMRFRDPENEDTLFTQTALAMVENIDWNVGRINEKLAELKLEENTIVIYLSDNGPNGNRWNGDMKGRKGSTDEGGVRSPMMMKWAGTLEPGMRIEQITSSIDILPTLCDIANIKVETNKPIDGVSLKPLIMAESTEWEERLIFNYWRERLSVRSQDFRLDHEDQLFDMTSDQGQRTNVAAKFPDVYDSLKYAKTEWLENVASELPEDEERPITIGHPEFIYNQIPARDAKVTGSIQRSNRWPNCSFFTNWVNSEDEIFWDTEVLENGTFDVELYYTCSEANLGSEIELICGDGSVKSKITVAHDPPLIGADDDIYPRMESYVKDFKMMKMGEIKLKKGKHKLRLTANSKPGIEVMDFRLLMLKRKTT